MIFINRMIVIIRMMNDLIHECKSIIDSVRIVTKNKDNKEVVCHRKEFSVAHSI